MLFYHPGSSVIGKHSGLLLHSVQVLLYDPLFDWTMNPLKALYLQQRPEDDTELQSTPAGEDQECKRNLR